MSKQDNMLNYRKRRIITMPSLDDVKVIPDIKVTSNIYTNENYPKEMSFKVVSGKNDEMAVRLSLELPFEKKVSLPDTTVCDGGTVTVQLPDISDIFGIFYLDVTVENKNGECVCEQPITFSHIRVGKRGGLAHCGCCAHTMYADLKGEKAHFAYETFDILSLFGSGICRGDLSWSWVEKEKGKFDFAESFHILCDYALERGISPHFILDYGNPFYDDGKSPITDEGFEAFGRYCTEVAKHLKGRVHHYEVWNEYNSGFSREEATPETYARTVKVAYEAVKAVDPTVKITIGVTVGTHCEWIRRVLSYDLYDYVDEVSIHPYCTCAYPDENQGNVEKNAQAIRDVISEFGEPKPVWASEIGWTVYNDKFSFSREEQAAAITRLFAIAETSDVLEKVTMYDIRNDTSNALEMEPNWGMIEYEDSIVPFCLKESAAAACCLNYMIGDAEYSKTVVTKDIKNIIHTKNGKTVNTLWSLDGRKKVTLNLSGECEAYDMYGTLVEKVSDGEYVTEINENPVYYVGGEVTVKDITKPDKIYYDFPYSVSAVPVLKEDGWYVKALVKNHSRILRGRLRVEMPELQKDSGYKDFLLREGESDFVETKVGEVDFKILYRALIEINLWSGEHYTTSEQISFLEVPYGDYVEFTLDMDDYKTIGDYKPFDVKANVKMSYTDESLILKVDVEEETHIQYAHAADNWKDLWDGDGVELMIQPIYDGHSDLMRYNQIGLGLSSYTGEKLPWIWKCVSNRGAQKFYNCIFDAERKDGITSYSAEFKWKDLLPPNVEFSDCDSFGFSLKINKTDDPEDIKGYLSLYRGIGWWKPPYNNAYTPLEFGCFVLGERQVKD